MYYSDTDSDSIFYLVIYTILFFFTQFLYLLRLDSLNQYTYFLKSSRIKSENDGTI